MFVRFLRPRKCYRYSTKLPMLPFSSFQVNEDNFLTPKLSESNSQLIFPYHEMIEKYHQNKNWSEFISWINSFPKDQYYFSETATSIFYKMMQDNFPHH